MSTYHIKGLWRSDLYRDIFIKYMMKKYQVDTWGKTFHAIRNTVRSCQNSDQIILKKIMKILNAHPKKQIIDASARTSDRSNIATKFINEIKVTKYIDYGCGDGSITQEIGQSLGLSRENIIGIDKLSCDNPAITYMQRLDIDIRVELVTAFVAFHHFENLEEILQKIADSVIPGGILVIREHDFDGTEQMKDFLNAIHLFLAAQEGDYTDAFIKNVTYKSKSEWTDILLRYGFEFVSEETYQGHNPQALYYACYVKK